MKEVLSFAPVLHFFDSTVISTIQADASKSGLAACLLQKGKPIVYASRSLSSSECNYNYAQIEKELFGHRICQYICGFHTKIQSDHKLLESMMLKALQKVSPGLQRMLLKLQKYDLVVHYVHERQGTFCNYHSISCLPNRVETGSASLTRMTH